mmetsp:Transcript_63676/g.134170  ORF Transcript_63676/g.134170 Transcript_63676/m.134170 type:complete len:253 (+) Transcript_63676:365-1123(+)
MLRPRRQIGLRPSQPREHCVGCAWSAGSRGRSRGLDAEFFLQLLELAVHEASEFHDVVDSRHIAATQLENLLQELCVAETRSFTTSIILAIRILEKDVLELYEIFDVDIMATKNHCQVRIACHLNEFGTLNATIIVDIVAVQDLCHRKLELGTSGLVHFFLCHPRHDFAQDSNKHVEHRQIAQEDEDPEKKSVPAPNVHELVEDITNSVHEDAVQEQHPHCSAHLLEACFRKGFVLFGKVRQHDPGYEGHHK